VKCARSGFEPIRKKARGSVTRSSAVLEADSGSDPGTKSPPFRFPVSSVASSALPPVDMVMSGRRGREQGWFWVLAPDEVGSPEGRVPPISFVEESTPKTLIQYKRKLRKPKLVAGQGDHDDVGFLRQGFLKSSSSHLFSSVPDAPSVVEVAGGVQPFSALEWSMVCSTVGFGIKGQEDKTVAYLSALEEEHMREDKLEGCEY